MSSPSVTTAIEYQCLFCGKRIEPGKLDPCALNLVAKVDQPRLQQKEQTFYCHLDCLQSRAAVKPATFYIADSDFPTIGECEGNS
jgi:hypothetical protein